VTFRVALTFDAEHPDRPAAFGNVDRLLDALEAVAVRATFFVQGRWAEAHPRAARRIGRDGHLVGSHSHYHARMPLLSRSGFDADVRHAQAAIVEHAEVDPRPWFRLPFGAGGMDQRILARLADLGYEAVGWNVTSEDWEPERSAADIVRIVVDGAARRGDGAVVLQHTWPDQTLAAIGDIVRRLRDAGGSFVTVDAFDELPEDLVGYGSALPRPFPLPAAEPA
jgi:peptidoglycan/xylan/chitin deacetylase (PgdA/CDA1 family)